MWFSDKPPNLHNGFGLAAFIDWHIGKEVDNVKTNKILIFEQGDLESYAENGLSRSMGNQ
jgi:hypothetical protein